MDDKTILVWFRNDLRTHDNEILHHAVKHNRLVIPVFCFDLRQYGYTRYGTKKTGVLRAAFIRNNVIALKESIQKLGGNLITKIGYPEEIIPAIAQKYRVNEVYHHREVAYEETRISALVEGALWKMRINLRHFIGHTLYHKKDLPFPIRDIPDDFTVFKKKTERESSIRPAMDSPRLLAVPENLESTTVPELDALGFTQEEIGLTDQLEFESGENTALNAMQSFLSGSNPSAAYSRLSPYIAVGALSPNTFYHAIRQAEATLDKKQLNLYITKLMRRDYYRFMFKKHGNRFFHEKGLTGRPPARLEDDEKNFTKWKTANTGHPLVDSGMRQLNETGYIPEQLRVILAAYLIQELRVNWLKGAAWFEEKLIDYGPSNNYGNWAHLAGVGSSIKENKPVDVKRLSTQFSQKEALESQLTTAIDTAGYAICSPKKR